MSGGRHKRNDHPCIDCGATMFNVDVALRRCPPCRKIHRTKYHHAWQLKRDGGVRRRLAEIAVVHPTNVQRREAIAEAMRRRQRVPIYQHAKLQGLDPEGFIRAVGAILNDEAAYVNRK